MSGTLTLQLFEPSLEALKGTLPAFYSIDSGEVAVLLSVLAQFMDELSQAAEGILADQAIATASDVGLREQWAVLYGAADEQLPPTTDGMRAYLLQRAADDGTVLAMMLALRALLFTPDNTAGTELVFPADGSGLTFPSNGSGLTMFQAIDIGFWLGILDTPESSTLTVTYLEFLAFDMGAFTRIVKRFRPAHYFAPVLVPIRGPL